MNHLTARILELLADILADGLAWLRPPAGSTAGKAKGAEQPYGAAPAPALIYALGIGRAASGFKPGMVY